MNYLKLWSSSILWNEKVQNISTNTYIFEVEEFQNITNGFKQILKLQDMSFNKNLMLCNSVITRFVNYILKVDIPK